MIKVACAIIKNKKGRILLVQRSKTMPHPLLWEFPGGKLRPAELAEAAIVREIEEELNIMVLPIHRLEEVIWKYPDKQIGLVPIICEIRSGEIILHEHLDYKWLTTQEIAKMNLLPADRAILIQLKKES